MIVSAACLMVVSLITFEYVTGLPASVRGDPIYNTLPVIELPSVRRPVTVEYEHPAAVDETFMDRVCDRVVRRFISDDRMWSRVNERIEKRFGFSCKH